ncbi:uncharacterized protein BDZ99DRAFT_4835 [Mytilinidion resinicola]|uniref:C2H2-type domain-containing protein n=1 Tax=Mytilinidion resinicola TaxID=574789 RepID=A0A6A6Z7B9_9PEZI|nr:uncharacterized protein BDZ99DRAFT_4835 [Mytilinidion resinicola]KAF2816930.1 hypothetical protein BDZ99DRAFT_4835 [Mytilinidion resinicola]
MTERAALGGQRLVVKDHSPRQAEMTCTALEAETLQDTTKRSALDPELAVSVDVHGLQDGMSKTAPSVETPQHATMSTAPDLDLAVRVDAHGLQDGTKIISLGVYLTASVDVRGLQDGMSKTAPSVETPQHATMRRHEQPRLSRRGSPIRHEAYPSQHDGYHSRRRSRSRRRHSRSPRRHEQDRFGRRNSPARSEAYASGRRVEKQKSPRPLPSALGCVTAAQSSNAVGEAWKSLDNVAITSTVENQSTGPELTNFSQLPRTPEFPPTATGPNVDLDGWEDDDEFGQLNPDEMMQDLPSTTADFDAFFERIDGATAGPFANPDVEGPQYVFGEAGANRQDDIDDAVSNYAGSDLAEEDTPDIDDAVSDYAGNDLAEEDTPVIDDAVSDYASRRAHEKNVRGMHDRRVLYPCTQEDCTAGPYTTAKALKVHEKNKHGMHGGTVRFPCIQEGCTVSPYTTASDLKRHEKTKHGMHGGTILFPCTQEGCTVSPFTRASDLKKHERRKHGMHGGAAFSCPICFNGSRDQSSLESHMTTRHPMYGYLREPLTVFDDPLYKSLLHELELEGGEPLSWPDQLHCPRCNTAQDDWSTLHNHILKACTIESFPCPWAHHGCLTELTRASDKSQAHLATHLADNRGFPCLYGCSGHFGDVYSLYCHEIAADILQDSLCHPDRRRNQPCIGDLTFKRYIRRQLDQPGQGPPGIYVVMRNSRDPPGTWTSDGKDWRESAVSFVKAMLADYRKAFGDDRPAVLHYARNSPTALVPSSPQGEALGSPMDNLTAWTYAVQNDLKAATNPVILAVGVDGFSCCVSRMIPFLRANPSFLFVIREWKPTKGGAKHDCPDIVAHGTGVVDVKGLSSVFIQYRSEEILAHLERHEHFPHIALLEHHWTGKQEAKDAVGRFLRPRNRV